MDNSTSEAYAAVFEQDRWDLMYVRNQTHELCMTAIEIDPCMAIKCVREQTPDLCMEAVKRNCWALENVRE